MINISLNTLFRSAVELLFPRYCLLCNARLHLDETHLCLFCLHSLPYTQYLGKEENDTEIRLRGRIDFNYATSLLWFAKGGTVQQLVHHIKYYGGKELGYFMGRLMGQLLLSTERFDQVDWIIPVPITTAKLIHRGYNQSEQIALGISGVLEKPLLSTAIMKSVDTPSQTRVGREERWENVAGSFMLLSPESIYDKKILLVDDILTTGATIDACAQALQQASGVQLFLATLAIVEGK